MHCTQNTQQQRQSEVGQSAQPTAISDASLGFPQLLQRTLAVPENHLVPLQGGVPNGTGPTHGTTPGAHHPGPPGGALAGGQQRVEQPQAATVTTGASLSEGKTVAGTSVHARGGGWGHHDAALSSLVGGAATAAGADPVLLARLQAVMHDQQQGSAGSGGRPRGVGSNMSGDDARCVVCVCVGGGVYTKNLCLQTVYVYKQYMYANNTCCSCIVSRVHMIGVCSHPIYTPPLYSHTLYSHTLYSHTLYSHTLYSHTLYSHNHHAPLYKHRAVQEALATTNGGIIEGTASAVIFPPPTVGHAPAAAHSALQRVGSIKATSVGVVGSRVVHHGGEGPVQESGGGRTVVSVQHQQVCFWGACLCFWVWGACLYLCSCMWSWKVCVCVHAQQHPQTQHTVSPTHITNSPHTKGFPCRRPRPRCSPGPPLPPPRRGPGPRVPLGPRSISGGCHAGDTCRSWF